MACLSACSWPEATYVRGWEHHSGDGNWHRLETPNVTASGDWASRVVLPKIDGPVPTAHLWREGFQEGPRDATSLTLDGKPLELALGVNGYYLLPPDHEGQLLEVHFHTNGLARRARQPVEFGPLNIVLLPYLKNQAANFAIGALLFFVGLILLVSPLVRRGRKTYFWMGFFLTSAGLGVVAGTTWSELIIPEPKTWRVVQGVCMTLAPFGSARFFLALFGDGPRRSLWLVSWALLGFFALALASDLFGVARYSFLQQGNGLIALATFAGLVRGITLARAGEKWARVFVVGSLLSTLIFLPDTLWAINVLRLPLLMAPWSLLALAITLGLTVEARFENNRERLGLLTDELAQRLEALEQRNREVGSLNRELRRQVAERSKDLAVLGAGLVSSNARLETGELFDGRFETIGLLGEGGMGSVYEVKRVSDGRSLALKLIRGAASKQDAQRFAREAEIAARIQHPLLVPVLDVGVSESGVMYMAMELVRGTTLEAQRAKFGDAAWARPLLADIATGLAALHEAGVVHRDLKPGNVLLETGTDGITRARISDFGLARWVDAMRGVGDEKNDTVDTPLTSTGMFMGTPMYMAPELARGAQRAQPSSDLFGFGVIAWELLTGTRPWPTPAVFQLLAGTSLVKPSVPPSLTEGALLLAALEVEPSRRPDAKAFAKHYSAQRQGPTASV